MLSIVRRIARAAAALVAALAASAGNLGEARVAAFTCAAEARAGERRH